MPPEHPSHDRRETSFSVERLRNGWRLLANCRLGDTLIHIVLIKPGAGVALIEISPAWTPTAITRLRQKMAASRFGDTFTGYLPIVHPRLKVEDLPRFDAIVSDAFLWQDPISIEGAGSWEDAVQAVLTPPPPAAAPPPPQLRHRRLDTLCERTRRRRRVAALAAACAAGGGLLLLLPQRDAPAPPSPLAQRVEPPARVAGTAEPSLGAAAAAPRKATLVAATDRLSGADPAPVASQSAPFFRPGLEVRLDEEGDAPVFTAASGAGDLPGQLPPDAATGALPAEPAMAASVEVSDPPVARLMRQGGWPRFAELADSTPPAVGSTDFAALLRGPSPDALGSDLPDIPQLDVVAPPGPPAATPLPDLALPPALAMSAEQQALGDPVPYPLPEPPAVAAAPDAPPPADIVVPQVPGWAATLAALSPAAAPPPPAAPTVPAPLPSAAPAVPSPRLPLAALPDPPRPADVAIAIPAEAPATPAARPPPEEPVVPTPEPPSFAEMAVPLPAAPAAELAASATEQPSLPDIAPPPPPEAVAAPAAEPPSLADIAVPPVPDAAAPTAGITLLPARPIAVVSEPVPASDPPPPRIAVPQVGLPSQPGAAPPSPRPALVDALLQRGRALIEVGDISGARRFFERAADAGSAAAALAMAETHDPRTLARQGVIGMPPDREAALSWYQRALLLGAPEAAPRITSLEAQR
ncbi:MAG TPA: hypothetical protein VGN83_24810 [Falsiroseomonas sp.]|nr:hypothetical protein [Falsiroseomonas sp.]